MISMTNRNGGAHQWTTPADLRRQVERLWERGVLLRAYCRDEMSAATVAGNTRAEVHTNTHIDTHIDSHTNSPTDANTDVGTELTNKQGDVQPSKSLNFPYRLMLKKPTSQQMGNQFEGVRQWILNLSEMRHVRVVYREVRHPTLGKNTLPQEVWIDTVDDASALIKKRGDVQTFLSLYAAALNHDKRLLPWLARRPLKVLELADSWSSLLRVHAQMSANPNPEIYLRQFSIAGIDTKFIESHREVLSEWLDMTLPESAIDQEHRGVRGFASRYGYKDKPLRFRLKSLDERQPIMTVARFTDDNAPDDVLTELGALPAGTAIVDDQNSEDSRTRKEVKQSMNSSLATADISLDIAVVRSLQPSHRQVLITENEINYLTLPNMKNTLAVFGSGYGWQSWADIPWLQQMDVYYWGDIDTHGFAILNQLRAHLPNVHSVLMNTDTLLAHEPLWGQEPTPTDQRLQRLTEEEEVLYQALVDNRYGDRVRLEQEQLDYDYVCEGLGAAVSR